MKDAIDRAAPCPTTVEAWLMKYSGRSIQEIESISGSFEEHCAARAVLALENAGAVFQDPTDKAFKSFKDAINQIQEEVPDGEDRERVQRDAPAVNRRSGGKRL